MEKNTIASRKVLGIFSLVMINVIAVDSLRTLPFSAEYGFSLVFFYLIAFFTFFIPISFVAAELATGWPNKGGVYVWVREAFGEKWGFLIIWLQWVYNVVWYPTILSFVAGALAFLINPQLAHDKFYMLSVILIIFWGSTVVNFWGMRISSAMSTIGALGGTLIPMLFIVFLGLMWLYQGKPIQVHFTEQAFFPDVASVRNLAFLTAILFGLIGMEMSAVHADEVKNPGRAYPRAILYSALIIFVTLIFASLAITMVVPHQQLSVVTGLIQAFQIFFTNMHMPWMDPVIIILIIIGGIGGVATWIIGPTKGLLVATRDGSAPPIFAKVNKRDVPVFLLILQGVIFTLLSLTFLLMPTVSSSYWLLTAITAQLALLVYVFLFAAALWLRYKKPEVKRDYRIPGGNIGIWIVVLLGILSSLGTMVLGFFPPSQLQVGNIFIYESVLIVGVIGLCLPPFIMYALRKPSWGSNC